MQFISPQPPPRRGFLSPINHLLVPRRSLTMLLCLPIPTYSTPRLPTPTACQAIGRTQSAFTVDKCYGWGIKIRIRAISITAMILPPGRFPQAIRHHAQNTNTNGGCEGVGDVIMLPLCQSALGVRHAHHQ